MKASSPASSVVTQPLSIGIRILRYLALAVLFAAYLLLLILATVPVGWNNQRFFSGWLILAVVLAAPVVLRIVIKRFRPRPWMWMSVSTLIFLPVFAYLGVDDAMLRHPVTPEEIAPAFPGAEKSYEVLMRYGKAHPLAPQ